MFRVGKVKRAITEHQGRQQPERSSHPSLGWKKRKLRLREELSLSQRNLGFQNPGPSYV